MVGIRLHTILTSIQINYLIDEASATGKGANTVVSLLHHFFSTHTFGESSVHLHADNCSGQNKNRHVIAYLMWRVLTGRHKQITLSFLIVGHTKFSPDTCFGLIKRLYRRTYVGCLDDISKMVSNSSVVNKPQLVLELRMEVQWSQCITGVRTLMNAPRRFLVLRNTSIFDLVLNILEKYL